MLKHFFAAGLALLPALIHAQSNTGEISGRLTDTTGAVIAKGAVTATNTQTGVRHPTLSNESGYYAIPLLNPGTYDLDVTLTGFKAIHQANVEMHVDEKARLDFTLQPGSASETITVTADAPLLDADQSSLGAVVNNRSIVNLPLNGRNAYDLVLLTPGTQQYARPNLPGNNIALSNISINGGPAMTNEYLIDGIPNETIVQSQFVIVPSVDSVEEFKVQTSSLPAEFGRTGGGVINLTVKSGTNAFHGDTYEFLRNNVFDANNWFNNSSGTKRPAFRYNQFGGTAGGPIRKDRTFFFAGYEGLRRIQGETNIVTVPTLAMRQGNFAGLQSAAQPLLIYDPLTTRASADGKSFVRDAFPGNRIPASRFDPVAVQMLTYWPAPNLPGDAKTGANNFISTAGEQYESNQFTTRIDHQLTDKHHIFSRYTHNLNMVRPPNIFGNVANPSSGPQSFAGHSGSVNEVWTINPATLATFRLGVSRLIDNGVPYGKGFDITALGFPAYYAQAQTSKQFPQITITGMNVSNLGFGSSALGAVNSSELFNPQNMYVAQSDITLIRGRHSVKAGVDARVFRVDGYRPSNGGGSFSFTPGFTQGPDPTKGTPASGQAVASFLLGTAAGGNIVSNATQDFQSFYVGLFAQDDFKLSPKLTLNLGLRWEPESYRTDRFNRLTFLDFNSPSPLKAPSLGRPVLGGLDFAGVDGNPRAQERTSWQNWGPRIGFAWQGARETVVRGGYGIFYVPRVWRGIGFGQQGFSGDTPFVGSVNGYNPVNFLSDPFPNGFTRSRGRSQGLLTNAGQAATSTNYGTVSSYLQQWNFNVQRALPFNMIMEVAYAGSRGTRLPANIEFNQIPNQYLALGNDLLTQVPNPFFGQIPNNTALGAATVSKGQLLRPFPQFTSFTAQADSNGSSIYHALQVRLEKRLSHGLSFLAAYTFSKLIDNGSAGVLSSFGGVPGFEDNNNRSLERSLGSQNVPHVFTLSYVYQLPSPSRNGALRLALGGWQLNGITSIQDGAPLALTTSTNPTLGQVGVGTLRPNNNGQSAALGGSIETRLNRYFNTSVFSQPGPWQFGNTARTLPDVLSPRIANFDLSLVKNNKFLERYRIQLRGEAFNIFNHPHFGPPGAAFGTPNFGVITNAGSARVIQVALKLYF